MIYVREATVQCDCNSSSESDIYSNVFPKIVKHDILFCVLIYPGKI